MTSCYHNILWPKIFSIFKFEDNIAINILVTRLHVLVIPVKLFKNNSHIFHFMADCIPPQSVPVRMVYLFSFFDTFGVSYTVFVHHVQYLDFILGIKHLHFFITWDTHYTNVDSCDGDVIILQWARALHMLPHLLREYLMCIGYIFRSGFTSFWPQWGLFEAHHGHYFKKNKTFCRDLCWMVQQVCYLMVWSTLHHWSSFYWRILWALLKHFWRFFMFYCRFCKIFWWILNQKFPILRLISIAYAIKCFLSWGCALTLQLSATCQSRWNFS